jgi:putative transposase
MPNTFSQIYLQVVFAVHKRQSLILPAWEADLYKYITGTISNKNQKLITINGIPDHIHIFIGMKPDCCLSDLVKDIKLSSNEFINDNKFTRKKFSWQEGFGAFSYSHSHIDKVYKYIANQKSHHERVSFKEEYTGLLKKFQIEYNEKYLFDFTALD